jgi:hypothetical protein
MVMAASPPRIRELLLWRRCDCARHPANRNLQMGIERTSIVTSSSIFLERDMKNIGAWQLQSSDEVLDRRLHQRTQF